MSFGELLDQASALLQCRGRVIYLAIKRQFQLDDNFLEDLKAELIYGQRGAVDEDGHVLVWTGRASLPLELGAIPAPHQQGPQAVPLTRVPSPLVKTCQHTLITHELTSLTIVRGHQGRRGRFSYFHIPIRSCAAIYYAYAAIRQHSALHTVII